jgi:hypothetical protein
MVSHSCPKCGSGWVHQHYCNGHHCNHHGARGCGPEHLRLTCSGCGYGWNAPTLDHRGSSERTRPTRRLLGKLLLEGGAGAPKLPTMHRRERWSTPVVGDRKSSRLFDSAID